MTVINTLVGAYRRRARTKRAHVFRAHLPLSAGSRVLDLGSEDGQHINSVLPAGMQVYIADIDPEPLQRGASLYGYTPVLISHNGPLPFSDGFFDVVFCSSVIEHVTSYGKDDCWRIVDQRRFEREARRAQAAFAAEIRRVGRRYFVQTPNRRFPIESHSWLPGLALLPRSVQVRVIGWANHWWVKKTIPDFHLLTSRDVKKLFPEATIIHERSLGLKKSIMAIR